ncbi:hypothetical protein [Metabacillus sp. RGM 3146]|uniref:hypothetical protein n=1 Tax=Metabacillus sp. RGM 3146 TaxID=3401092 RepID=UPI003B9D296C
MKKLTKITNGKRYIAKVDETLQGMYSALLNASNKGQEVSPLFFDSKAYKNSEMYKVNEEASKQAADYIKAKDEQSEARKVETAMIEKENRPWYQKGWDMASDFVGEASGYLTLCVQSQVLIR